MSYTDEELDFLSKVRQMGKNLGKIEMHFDAIIENLKMDPDHDEEFLIDVGMAYERGLSDAREEAYWDEHGGPPNDKGGFAEDSGD